MLDIRANNCCAYVPVEYETCLERLQADRLWPAEVLKLSGEYSWRVRFALITGPGQLGPKVIPGGDGRFIAWGARGRKSYLAYQVEPAGAGVKITPLPYLESTRKTAVAVTLAVLFIVPVLLAPLIWRWYEAQTVRASRVYLPAFCRYLQA